MSLPPAPGVRQNGGLWVGLAVGVAFAISAIEIVALISLAAAGVVVVNDAAFEAYTPPTVFCPFWETTGGPPISFEVRAGSVFNMSWGIGCEPYGPGNTTGASFEITSVTSSTWGFTVVGSNLPVEFGYDENGVFNVSVRAPSWAMQSTLVLVVQGGPVASS
jgi:hypothetical protein